MTAVAENLKAALALIPDASFWMKGGTGYRETKTKIQRCASVAIRDAVSDSSQWWETECALVRAWGFDPLTTFLVTLNDRSTYSQVRAAFELAIRNEDATI